MSNQASSRSQYLANGNYWISSAYSFALFFVMVACYPFLGTWLGDIHGLKGEKIDYVFSPVSLSALLFQPILGFFSDKLGIRKHLLQTLVILLLFYAPFFIYAFAPSLKTNLWLGVISDGAYMGLVFQAGIPASEAYIERISRLSGFEHGRARLFGMLGRAICASIAGNLYSSQPNAIFWLGSGATIVLLVPILLAKTDSNNTDQIEDNLEVNHSPITLKQALKLFSLPRFWALLAYIVGVACICDIFDQQFGDFFNTFFEFKEQGMKFFGYVTTGGELLNTITMFFVPLLINRIGTKNALLIAGSIMSIRITGSSSVTETWYVIVLKTLHMFEVLFYLVGVSKYIADVFEVRLPATIYLVCCSFSKQIGNMILSPAVGTLYDMYGSRSTYFILGCAAFVFTLISVFTLVNTKKLMNNA